MNQLSARNILLNLSRRWQEHRSARAALAELDGCDPSVVAEIARDVGIPPLELRQIVTNGIGADLLMKRMLSAYDIDLDELRQEAPNLVRDVAVLCSKCDTKKRCRRELDAGTARQNAADFCPNQPTFAALGS